MAPDISFVICTRDLSHVRALTRGLLALKSHLCQTSIELLIVGPSNSDLKEHLQRLNGREFACRAIASEWGNRNASRNLGFLHARGKWIYFVDQDIRFPKVRLAALAQILGQLPSQSAAYCMMSGPYLSPRRCGFWGRFYNWQGNLWLENSRTGARVLAGNLLMRKSFFIEPPFPEDLLNGGEEIFLCQKALNLGGGVVQRRELAVLHLAEHDFWRFCSRLFGHYRVKWQLPYEAKHTRIVLPLILGVARISFALIAFSLQSVGSGLAQLYSLTSRRTARAG